MACSLLNIGQQVGGAIGLAVLGTVAWSAVAGSLRTQAAARRPHVIRCAAAQGGSPRTRWRPGSPRGFLVSAGIALLALTITVATIRVTREDLQGD